MKLHPSTSFRDDSMLDGETKQKLLKKLQALRPDACFTHKTVAAYVNYDEEKSTFTGWWITDINVGSGRCLLMNTQPEKEFPPYFIGYNLDEAIKNMVLLNNAIKNMVFLGEFEAFASS